MRRSRAAGCGRCGGAGAGAVACVRWRGRMMPRTRPCAAGIDLHALVANVVDHDVAAKLVLAVAEPHVVGQLDDAVRRSRSRSRRRGRAPGCPRGRRAARTAPASLRTRASRDLSADDGRARGVRLQIRFGGDDVHGLLEGPATVLGANVVRRGRAGLDRHRSLRRRARCRKARACRCGSRSRRRPRSQLNVSPGRASVGGARSRAERGAAAARPRPRVRSYCGSKRPCTDSSRIFSLFRSARKLFTIIAC